MEDSQVAAVLSAQLAQRIGARRFELWFEAYARLCVDAGRLTILAASTFVRDCLRKNFADDIRACWEAIAGGAATIEFDVDATLQQREPQHPPGKCPPPSDDGETQAAPSRPARSESAASRPAGGEKGEQAPAAPGAIGLTLGSFVVGAGNEYAYRAAELAARGRQQASPVLFCGPTGVGKTHLMRAVLREYRRQGPRASAVYLTAEQFTTSFIEAIRGSGLPNFRQKCRGARLLLVDDLPFFVGKQRTVEELQHTVDSMLNEGRQLIFASDRNLAELRGLGPELISRLSGGLTCEIEPPDFATRMGILRGLRQSMDLSVDDDVLSLVAAQVTAGARELRGALHRLQAISLAYDEPITAARAERALADLARHNARTVRLADVQKVVCDVFGVEAAQLRSERKGRTLAEPRMLAMWLARKYTRAPWSEIGQFFGRRSHSTVISAHHRVEKLIGSQAQIAMSDRTCGVEEAIRKLETALRTA